MKGMPEPLRTHLQINASVGPDTPAVVRAVVEYIHAKVSWRMSTAIPGDQGQAPMDLSALKDVNKDKKAFKGKSFNCGKMGHRASECRQPKSGAINSSQER